MIDSLLVTLYARNVVLSADFYSALLDRKPVHQSENYAQFDLGMHARLGLWQQSDVVPRYDPSPDNECLCRNEIDFPVETREAVDALFMRWKTHGVPIVEAPTEHEFGYGFLVSDPDGHRLRVLSPPG